MRIERWVSGILHGLGDDSTQEDAVYVVTNRIGLVSLQTMSFNSASMVQWEETHSSKVSKMSVLFVLKFGSLSKGKSQ